MQSGTACLDFTERGACSVTDPSVERLSVYDDCEREANRYKWIESEKAGCDLGDEAIKRWVGSTGPVTCGRGGWNICKAANSGWNSTAATTACSSASSTTTHF